MRSLRNRRRVYEQFFHKNFRFLIDVCRGGCINLIRKHLVDCDVDAYIFYGQTLLHLAVVYDQADLVLFLLSNRATVDVKIPDEFSDGFQTPLHFACIRGYDKIIRILLDKGANVNAVTQENVTPLMFACRRTTSTDILSLLIDRGSDVNACNNAGATALYSACCIGSTKSVETLLLCGADPNKAKIDKTTPLFEAVERGFIDIVRLLLKYGSNVNAERWDWQTPLMLAITARHCHVIHELLEHGAEIPRAYFAERFRENKGYEFQTIVEYFARTCMRYSIGVNRLDGGLKYIAAQTVYFMYTKEQLDEMRSKFEMPLECFDEVSYVRDECLKEAERYTEEYFK